MKLALIGHGKMGQLIEQHALAKGHMIIDRQTSSSSECACVEADVLIDFSHPSNALASIKKAAKLRKNLVMGTTGWYQHLDEVQKIVNDAGIGFIYAANFSLGMAFFYQIVAKAAQLIASFDDYDVSGYEIHHNKKVDAPSGAARELMQLLNAQMPRKQETLISPASGSEVPPEPIPSFLTLLPIPLH